MELKSDFFLFSLIYVTVHQVAKFGIYEKQVVKEIDLGVNLRNFFIQNCKYNEI